MKLVVVSQNGCNPCQQVKNFLKDEGVEFELVNISETPEAIEEYGVMSTPVTILIDEEDDNEEIGRVNGFDEEAIEVLVDQL
jgi:thioredoxin 1